MIKIFKTFKRNDWLIMLAGFLFIILQVALDLKIPDYMSQITQLIQTPSSPISEVWKTGGIMLLCALASFACMAIVGLCTAKLAARISRRLRSLLYDQVNSFSTQELNHFSTSSLINRSTSDITQIQMFIAVGLQFLIKAPVMAVWALSKISGKSSAWTTATLIAVLLMTLIVTFILIFVLPRFQKMQTLSDNLNKVVMENLSGLRVVRAYNAEAYQKDKFTSVNEELTKTQLFTSRSMSIMMPMISAIMSFLSLAIYLIGAVMINQAQITERLTLFSDMIVFSSYAMQVVMSFLMMVIVFILLPRASVSAKRISEVLETSSSIQYGSRLEGLPDIRGEIKFEHVDFKYPQAADYALKNISFTAKQGETIAFIGSTGSGKSTLVQLLARFLDPTNGEILIDGIPAREYEKETLYSKIGYVPQKATLFTGTVSTNVGYGEGILAEYTESDIKHAISIAQGTEFVEQMDDSYQASIARGGTNISGGQKQRLAIARALCRKPEIFIFDDSFSALDYKTDRALRTDLNHQMQHITKIIVAQRISTIMDADQIIVLDEGSIVGQGTHPELLASCEIYQQIANTQLNEEELKS